MRSRVYGRSAILMALVLLAPVAQASADPQVATTTPADSSDLTATTAAPWNPSKPVARRRAWEQAMLMPGRIVSLPLSGLGQLADRGLLYAEQSGRISTSGNTLAPSRTSGVLFQVPHLGGRSGIGAGVEAREPFLSGPLRTRWSARYAGTVRNYNGSLLTVTGEPLTLQYGYDWRPEEHFYGVGPSTPREGFSDFARQSEFVRATVGHEWLSDAQPRRGTRVGLWAETRNDVTRSGRQIDVASYEENFPAIGAATLNRRVQHLDYGATVSGDWRSGVPHWGSGARLLLSAERHDAPVSALALHGGIDGAQYNRYLIEGETGFSFMRNPRTVRVMARVVDTSVGANGELFLPSDYATLGGKSGLAGYTQDRFHDLDLALVRTAYVFPIARRLELDLHSEWGSVYPDVWKNATLGSLHNSFGVTLRGVYALSPVAAIGLDFSHEGVRVNYSIGGVE